MWYCMSNMSETYTPTPQTESESEFDKQTDISLDLANGVPAAQEQPADDLAFFNELAERARAHVDIQSPPSHAQEVTVNHKKPSAVKRVIAGTTIAAAAVAGGAWATDKVMDIADEHFQNVEEQNRKWAQEAEESLRQFDEGIVQIEIPNEEQK